MQDLDPLNEKLAKLFDEHPWMEPDILARLVTRVAQENASHTARRAQIVSIADRFNGALSNYAACKEGCSFCCYMPTMIYEHEAERLAYASGRNVAQLSVKPVSRALEDAKRYSGTACPFLKEGKCSVYDARPLICRLHHSLNENPEDCRITGLSGTQNPVARFDVDAVEMPFHYLMFEKRPVEAWACIHQFFPD